jgi:hypothetical protein
MAHQQQQIGKQINHLFSSIFMLLVQVLFIHMHFLFGLFRHVGDMGNITADASGTATLDSTFDLLSLTGEHNIIGRAVMIHSTFDDGITVNTGNAGSRIAIGVIGISNVALPSAGVVTDGSSTGTDAPVYTSSSGIGSSGTDVKSGASSMAYSMFILFICIVFTLIFTL